MFKEYAHMIHCRVRRSDGELFKSNQMVNTVNGVLHKSKQVYFTFVEDDSEVECWRCCEAESASPLYEGYLNSPEANTMPYQEWLESTLTKSNELLEEWLRAEELRGGEV